MVSPVKFMHAITHVCSQSSKKLGQKFNANKNSVMIDHFLEIGPHAALQGPLRDILHAQGKASDIGYSSMLFRGKSALVSALEAAGNLYCIGYPVNLRNVNRSGKELREPSMLTNLPAYPFNHDKKYWLESRLSKDYRFRRNPAHEFLGTASLDWNLLEPRWRKIITQADDKWIKDHQVLPSILLILVSIY